MSSVQHRDDPTLERYAGQITCSYHRTETLLSPTLVSRCPIVRMGRHRGTDAYMAPEIRARKNHGQHHQGSAAGASVSQTSIETERSKKADVWSTGVVLYEMLMMTPTHAEEWTLPSIDEVAANDPRRPLFELLGKMLVYDADTRHSVEKILTSKNVMTPVIALAHQWQSVRTLTHWTVAEYTCVGALYISELVTLLARFFIFGDTGKADHSDPRFLYIILAQAFRKLCLLVFSNASHDFIKCNSC